ncbi:MAG: Resolvase domain protein [Edaphobacter sp.]|nr:Resolvase domain protein [Edaphobacter sp.]
MPLPFSGASFDAITCIDAINHFSDRPRVIAEWARLLKVGGRLLFTEPITLTGPLAEHEASMISGRTKAALAAAKTRGVRLGGQRGSLDRMGRMAQKGNVVSAAVRRAATAKRNDDLLPVIDDIRAAGLTSPQQIADGLNQRGIAAARGGAWSAVQVRRVLSASLTSASSGCEVIR